MLRVPCAGIAMGGRVTPPPLFLSSHFPFYRLLVASQVLIRESGIWTDIVPLTRPAGKKGAASYFGNFVGFASGLQPPSSRLQPRGTVVQTMTEVRSNTLGAQVTHAARRATPLSLDLVALPRHEWALGVTMNSNN